MIEFGKKSDFGDMVEKWQFVETADNRVIFYQNRALWQGSNSGGGNRNFSNYRQNDMNNNHAQGDIFRKP